MAKFIHYYSHYLDNHKKCSLAHDIINSLNTHLGPSERQRLNGVPRAREFLLAPYCALHKILTIITNNPTMLLALETMSDAAISTNQVQYNIQMGKYWDL